MSVTGMHMTGMHMTDMRMTGLVFADVNVLWVTWAVDVRG